MKAWLQSGPHPPDVRDKPVAGAYSGEVEQAEMPVRLTIRSRRLKYTGNLRNEIG